MSCAPQLVAGSTRMLATWLAVACMLTERMLALEGLRLRHDDDDDLGVKRGESGWKVEWKKGSRVGVQVYRVAAPRRCAMLVESIVAPSSSSLADFSRPLARASTIAIGEEATKNKIFPPERNVRGTGELAHSGEWTYHPQVVCSTLCSSSLCLSPPPRIVPEY